MKKIQILIPVILFAVLFSGSLSCNKTQKESVGTVVELKPLKLSTPLETLSAELAEFIPALMDQAIIPGLSIAVLREGKVFWNNHYGVTNAETQEKVAADTMFEACSLSKPVFAYAVLQLIDEGLLALDKPLVEYAPESYLEKKYLRDKSDDPRFNKITTRMVLSHTPGFPNWRQGKLTINFEPGAKFSYSGEGFVFLQRIVEHITGQELDDFMTERVFEPLGMKNSTYIWKQEIDGQLANPHSEFGKPGTKRKPWNNAAASLVTTAEDYARVIAAIMNSTRLKPETSQAMLSSQINIPAEEYPGSLSWGLGVGLQHTEQGDIFWHWGDNHTFRCFFAAYPKERIGVVYFANSANGLGIIKEILTHSIGGTHAISSLPMVAGYPRFDSPLIQIGRTYVKEGFAAALQQYWALKKASPGTQITQEPFLNNLGYALLRMNKTDEAIRVFQMNVEFFPDSFNVYDSLGEAYKKKGEKEKAIENYRISIKLNPENEGGKLALKQLEKR